MNKPRDFVCRCSSLKDALAALGRLPGILHKAFTLWGSVDIVVREHVEKRSNEQNRLQRLWCKEAGEQLEGSTAEYWRGYCKYMFGIKILCRDSKAYRDACKRVLGALSHEQRIELMMEPHDYPVTRGMTKPQKSEYLQLIYEFFTEQGVRLTEPGMLGRENYKEAV